MAQQQSRYTSAYMTPLKCVCGGFAHLTRRRLDLAHSDGSEWRVFTCEKCGKTIELNTDEE